MVLRAWTILLGMHADGRPFLRIFADGRHLLPDFTCSSPVEALEYLDGALVDCRPGDRITLIAPDSVGDYASWSTNAPTFARQWCASLLAEAWYHRAFAPTMKHDGERA